jgi:SP family galactose:H+ symporter-like MFS transporter
LHEEGKLTLVTVLGHAMTSWLCGVIAVVAWVFIYRLLTETKGKSLEQIEEHWRTGKHPRES